MNSSKIYSFIGNVTPLYDFGLYLAGYQKSVEYFVSQLPFNREDSLQVLDAGCGTGLYSLAILKRFKNARITAFDFNEQLVERLRGKIAQAQFNDRANLFSADIQSPLEEIKDEKFNLIITSGVLEHVPQKETVKNLNRFLLEGGYFFNSPVRDTQWGRIVAGTYGCAPYAQLQNIKTFEENDLMLQKIIYLPWYVPASFKEAHIFKNTPHDQ